MPAERMKFLREKAITAIGLTKGFIPEQRDHFSNALKTVEEFAGYIQELTNESPDSKEASWFDALMNTGVTLQGPSDCTDKLMNEYLIIKKQ
jgi:hypothetical protein